MSIGLYIALGIVLFLLILILPNAIKIVPEYQPHRALPAGAHAWGSRGPGLVFIIPLVDRAVCVDLRELYLEIPHQSAITRGQRHDLHRLHHLPQVVDADDERPAGAELRRRRPEHRRDDVAIAWSAT